jgi:hypothetical protein
MRDFFPPFALVTFFGVRSFRLRFADGLLFVLFVDFITPSRVNDGRCPARQRSHRRGRAGRFKSMLAPSAALCGALVMCRRALRRLVNVVRFMDAS